MPQDRPAPGSPENWLGRAKGDLALAQVELPAGGFYEDLCFHAQQAAEKAIKAVFVRQGWSFPYVHNLGVLVAELERQGLAVPPEVKDAVPLTAYAYEARYPDVPAPVTAAERGQAVNLASRVVRWAEGRIAAGK